MIDLIGRAGLSEELVKTGEVDSGFNAIMDQLMEVHRGKSVLYGNYLKTHGNEPINYSLMQHFLDMKRKYIRAENYVKSCMDDKPIDPLELVDTYADMAVYAALGVQLLQYFIERETDDIGS